MLRSYLSTPSRRVGAVPGASAPHSQSQALRSLTYGQAVPYFTRFSRFSLLHGFSQAFKFCIQNLAIHVIRQCLKPCRSRAKSWATMPIS